MPSEKYITLLLSKNNIAQYISDIVNYNMSLHCQDVHQEIDEHFVVAVIGAEAVVAAVFLLKMFLLFFATQTYLRS